MTGLLERIRREVHRRPGIYRTVKFLKKSRTYPLDKLTNVRDAALIWSVITSTMLSMKEMMANIEAIESLNSDRIDGDIVECGIWSGGCLGLMAKTDMRNPSTTRRYIGFDSFEGLPQPTPEDVEYFGKFKQRVPGPEQIAEDAETAARSAISKCVGAREPEVRRFLCRDLGIPADRLELVVGWFEDTVPAWARTKRRIAMLRLDGDWYHSTRVCLENLYPFVEPHGIVVIDDYNCFDGCKRAVDEFRDKNRITTPLEATSHCSVRFRVPGG